MTTKAKSVVVTGAASGIGLAIAELLKDRDWQVHLVDANAEALAQASDKLGVPREHSHAASVTDETAMECAIAKAAIDGALGAVINSAGIAMDKAAVETTIDDFRRIVDVNLVGSFISARAAARHWLSTNGTGSIVNISSVSGILGSRGRSAYGSSKGAVNQLTKILATELGGNGIRVNAIAPGAIDTPLSRAVHTEDVRRQWNERIPQARYGTTREIANAAAFLISDEASYINGQILAVDGGFTTAGLVNRS